jgi:hypothetical protein
MAYIIKDRGQEKWRGPYPNKAGEFCGNDERKNLRVTADGTIEAVAGAEYGGWHSAKSRRIGRPSNCKMGTSEEMAAQGFVGIYLTADNPHAAVGVVRDVDVDVLQEEVVSGQRPASKPFRPDAPMVSSLL